MQARYGEDIVCAAVSALTINTVNSIDLFTTDKVTLSQDEEAAVIDVKFTGAISPETKLLMQSYETGITELAKQYPEVQVQIQKRG